MDIIDLGVVSDVSPHNEDTDDSPVEPTPPKRRNFFTHKVLVPAPFLAVFVLVVLLLLLSYNRPVKLVPVPATTVYYTVDPARRPDSTWYHQGLE